MRKVINKHLPHVEYFIREISTRTFSINQCNLQRMFVVPCDTSVPHFIMIDVDSKRAFSRRLSINNSAKLFILMTCGQEVDRLNTDS